MSTAILRSPEPESPYAHLVKRTIEACRVATEAAATAAEGIATASCPLLNTLREREKELDRLDMEIDAGVTTAITQVTATEARELLACMKFMISLERIGDLLLSFSSSAQSVCSRLDPQDVEYIRWDRDESPGLPCASDRVGQGQSIGLITDQGPAGPAGGSGTRPCARWLRRPEARCRPAWDTACRPPSCRRPLRRRRGHTATGW